MPVEREDNFIKVKWPYISCYSMPCFRNHPLSNLPLLFFLFKGLRSLQITSVGWGVLLLGSRPQRGNAHNEGECTVLQYLNTATSVKNISTSDWHYKCVLILVVVERMGPATGISCSPCERAALWTTAGPGPVDASGWSLTWKWDPVEGWTQGKRIHRKGIIILLSISMFTCTSIFHYYSE